MSLRCLFGHLFMITETYASGRRRHVHLICSRCGKAKQVDYLREG